MEEKRRSFLWDNAKGLLILSVVFGHFIYGYIRRPSFLLIITVIYAFHMPAFAFISGRFTKGKYNFRKLIIAYVIFNGLFLFYSLHETGTFTLIQPYYVCWYLIALCVWRLLTPHIAKYKFTLPVLIAISLLCGFAGDITNDFAIARILSFWPFFMCGYLLKDYDFEKARKKYRLPWGIVFGLLFLVSILQGCRFTNITDSDFLMLPYQEPVSFFIRIILFVCAAFAILSIIFTLPDKKIPLVSSWGRNSMSIYLLHRFFTLFIPKYYPSGLKGIVLLFISLGFSIVVCMLLGNDQVSSVLNRILSPSEKNERVLSTALVALISCSVAAVMITSSVLPYLDRSGNGNDLPADEPATEDFTIYRVIPDDVKQQYDDSFKIIFAGDLILLEDQVKRGYDQDSGTYDFHDLFAYTEDEISSADLAIGVLEGPLVESSQEYSVGNYDDGKELRLGFPDAWAEAISDAGFDLVTTANNHMLDRGEEAAYRTMDKLDEIGLDYTGTYRDEKEKESRHIHMIEKNGIRIAVLSYTFGMNYHTTHDLMNGSLSSFLVDPSDEMYEQVRASVKADSDEAKALGPDLILVLPHMGTQFLDAPDEYQKTWHDNFVEFGADIILSDHTHSVQPAFLEKASDRMVFTAFCPGNYANVYRDYNGDATALVEVFIDRETKRPIGGGVVPMWVSCPGDGNYRPVPIYDIVTDPDLGSSYTTYDMQRVDEVQKHITGVMLGTPLSLDMAEPVYYFDETGFMRTKVPALELTSDLENSSFMQKAASASSICFIGDSLTHGSMNGGIPWYEPLLPHLQAKISNVSYGGWTTCDLLSHKEDIPASDLYIIAIGCNDIRYNDPAIGAVTKEDYISNLKDLKKSILSKSPDASFIFIAPWISTDGDLASKLPYPEVTAKRESYSAALRDFCQAEGDTWCDPNTYIQDILLQAPQTEYLVDWIHANRQHGVEMYSMAVLSACS